MPDCILGIENKEKILALERGMGEMKSAIHEQSQKLDEIRDKLLGRPTWKVAMTFTGLITVVAVLLQALLK